MECGICCQYINEVINCTVCNYPQCETCIIDNFILNNLNIPQCNSCKTSLKINHIIVNLTLENYINSYKNNNLFLQYKINKYEQIYRTTEDEKTRIVAKISSEYLQRKYHISKSEDKTQLWSLSNINNIICRCQCENIIYGNYYCNVCDKTICRWCYDYSHEGKCDEDKLKTREMLDNLIKCINCGIIIEKYEGCSEIQCENCTTRFDTNQNRIITDYSHEHKLTSPHDILKKLERYIVMNCDKRTLKRFSNFDYARFIDNNQHICDELSYVSFDDVSYPLKLFKIMQMLLDCKYTSKDIYLTILANMNYTQDYIYDFIVSYDSYDMNKLDILIDKMCTIILDYLDNDKIHELNFDEDKFMNKLFFIHEKLTNYCPKLIDIKYTKKHTSLTTPIIVNLINKYRDELQSL